MAPTRNGFGRGLVVAGHENKDVVALCADLAESTRAHWFREEFPKRYIEIGVAEQNLAAVAAGMAAVGKKPFIMSYAAFSPGRNNEQIRTTISLNDQPVVIVGCHAGVSVGPDGATHQALEDIALMQNQPNMTVVVPCDSNQAKKATEVLARFEHPSYLRLARDKSAVFTTEETPFEIGKAYVYFAASETPDVVIYACGGLVFEAMKAAIALHEQDIQCAVINVATIKPLDEATIVTWAERARAVVTVEEHQVAGGLGSAIANLLAQTTPRPIEFVGVKDRFGQSGTTAQLYREYELDEAAITAAVKKVARRSAS
jgi:transketolase